jgi:hypothetical protein
MGIPMNVPTGLVIWVCEGTKRNHRQVEVVNDNELLVKAFIEYLNSFAVDEKGDLGLVCNAQQKMSWQNKFVGPR